MVWALLTACTSPGPTDAEASPEPGLTGGERQFEDTGLPAGPAWSLEEVAARLAEVLSEPAPTSGGMALSYEELMSHRTLSCPQAEMPTLDAWVVWASQGAPCTTEEGWSWYGLANGAGGCMTGDGIDQVDVGALVSFEATDPQGQVFAAGGTFYQGCSFSESEGACVGALTGAFHYPAASGWLADGEGIGTSFCTTAASPGAACPSRSGSSGSPPSRWKAGSRFGIPPTTGTR
jgi:hypothetical protein